MLFVVSCSPETGATSTLTVVFCANGTCPRSLMVTVFVWPGLMSARVFVYTIAPCGFWIVTVTLIPTSC